MEFKKRASFRRNDSTKKVSLPSSCCGIRPLLQSSPRLQGVLPRVGNDVFRFANRDIRKHGVHLLQDELQVLYSSFMVPRSRWEFTIDELGRDFRHLFSRSLQGCCCNLDSCSNLSFESELCSIVVIAPPQVLLRFTAHKIPGPPDSFSAELSSDTTQPRIRATILGALHSPGANNLNERQSPLRYRRNAAMAPLPTCRESFS